MKLIVDTIMSVSRPINSSLPHFSSKASYILSIRLCHTIVISVCWRTTYIQRPMNTYTASFVILAYNNNERNLYHILFRFSKIWVFWQYILFINSSCLCICLSKWRIFYQVQTHSILINYHINMTHVINQHCTWVIVELNCGRALFNSRDQNFGTHCLNIILYWINLHWIVSKKSV